MRKIFTLFKFKKTTLLLIAAISSIWAYSSSATDYFRSKQTGVWNATTTWQSSSNGTIWLSATLVPTSSAKGITVRNGDIVTLQGTIAGTSYSASNLVINSGGMLVDGTDNNRTATLSISNNTSGYDFINNGTFELNGTQPTFDAGATAQMNNLVLVESNYQSSTSDDFAANTSVYFTNGSVFQWDYPLSYGTNGVIYFPNSGLGVTPIFLVSQNITVGAATSTTVNGKAEVASGKTVTLINKGDKIFRDGIGGTGTIIHSGSQNCGSIRVGTDGTNTTNAVIDGSPTIIIENTNYGTTYDFEIAGTTTISGTPTLNIGDNSYADAELGITGSVTNNSTTPIYLDYGDLTVAGSVAGTGSFRGTSTYTDVKIQGSSGGSAGILRFTSGYNTIKTFTMNRTGSSGEIDLGNDFIINATTTLKYGAFAINGYTLTLNGTESAPNGSSGGTLSGSTTSNLVIGGTANSLYFTQSSMANYLKNFTISGTATLLNALNIAASNGSAANTFGIITANGTLTTGGLLTLKSDAYGDAIVGNSSGSINGNTTVERYIPAKRAWRFLSVPVNNNTLTINSAWQEGVVNPDYTTQIDPYPGFGTEITFTGTNGFDPNTTTSPSIKYWDNSINDWNSPTSTYTNINTYPAYCLFVRGSRAINLSQGIYATPDNTVLRATGTLNTGSFVKTYNTTAGNDVLISNPYACPVSITAIIAANSAKFSNKFWVWDPGYYGNYGVGGYISYSGASGLSVPSGSSYTGGTNAQSGQAFILEVTNPGATTNISFTESDKIISETNVFSREIRRKTPSVYTNLMIPSGNSLILADGVAAGFGKEFSAAVNEDDVAKKWNFDENIALVRDDKRLAIELRPIPILTDTLFFKLFLRKQPYVLQIFSENLPANLPAHGWLVDKYLNTKTPVSLYDTTLYSFTPNSDTNSYRNRFILVFGRQFIGTPVTVTNQANPGTTGDANSIASNTGSVNVYPNPVANGEKIILKFNSMVKGKYEVTVSNAAGKALTEKTIMHDGGTNTYPLQTDSRWAAGSYLVKITGESGYNFTAELVISK